MPALRATVAAIILTVVVPAPASAAPPMAGRYHLEGVMETGSELALEPDGTFGWYLAYGALDLFARGDWRQEDGAVILQSRRENGQPEPPFDEMRLVIRDQDLIPPDDHGAYVRDGADAQKPRGD